MITVTKKDVMKATLVDKPGWYPVLVKGVSTKPANTDGSTNFLFELEIAEGPYKEVGLKNFMINEKGIFTTGLAFLVACGFPKDLLESIKKGEAPDTPIDENDCVGKVINAFVGVTSWENRKSNEALDFLPPGATLPKVAGAK